MQARFGGPQGVYATGHKKELADAMKEFGVTSPGEALIRLLRAGRWRRDPPLRRRERSGRHPQASECVGGVRLRSGCRRRHAPALLRQLPAGAGPLRAGAAGAHLGRSDPQDDGAARGHDRPGQPRRSSRRAWRPTSPSSTRATHRRSRDVRGAHRDAESACGTSSSTASWRSADGAVTGEKAGAVLLRGPHEPSRADEHRASRARCRGGPRHRRSTST